MDTKLLFIVIASLILTFRSFGSDQDINCSSSACTTGTPGSTGIQKIAILFVDFPEGRKYDSLTHQYILPTVDIDTNSFPSNAQIDAVGSMGYEKDPFNPPHLKKKIRKYTYDDYWDMFFSDYPTYTSTRSPDSASHGILCYGSFKDYYTEVSYGNLNFVPYQTRSGGSDKYHIGIINPIDSVFNGTQWVKYVRWVMMPHNKPYYNSDHDQNYSFSPQTINPLIDSLYATGQTTFNRLDTVRVCIVYAGSSMPNYGGKTWNKSFFAIREKRYHNYENLSTLDGIWVAVHECGHTLGFDHIPSGTYDPMTPTFRDSWSRHLYSPPHFNPLYKFYAGWISYNDFVKIKSSTNGVTLPSSKTSHTFATVTLIGDALRNSDYRHSEYFVLEYKKREGFNRFVGGENATSFQGGVLIWHYSKFNAFNVIDQGEYTETSNIGLKVPIPNYFISDTGSPNHFYYAGHDSIGLTTTPNTKSLGSITTGLKLSNFSTNGGGQIVVDINYLLSSIPNWNYFIRSDIWNQTLGGFIFIDAGSINLNNVTISPGAEIHMAPSAVLYLDSVTADASSGLQIKIKSATSIYDPNLINVGSCCQLSSSILKNCMISNLETGTKIYNPYTQIILNNVIYDKCGTSIYLEKASGGIISPFPSLTNLSFSNMVIAGTTSSNIRQWSFANNQEFIIPINATVQIGPYNKFLMGVNSDIICNGAIIASGTSTRPITFTSSAIPPIPASWNWVQVNKGNSVFQYCTFEYGTYGLYLLNAYSGNPVDIENCNIRNNSSYGMKLSSSTAKIKSCEINNNRSHGVICNNDQDIKFIGNTIHDNSGQGIYAMSGGFLELYGNVMMYNYWYGLCTGGVNHIHLGQPWTWEGRNTISHNRLDEVNIGYGTSSLSIEMASASIHDSSGFDINNSISNPAVYTTNCYWGPNRTDLFSGPVTLNAPNYTSPPDWDCQPVTVGSPLGKISSTTIPDSVPWILDPRIMDAEKVKRCKEIIAKNTKSEEVRIALDWLYSVVRKDFVDNKLSERDYFYSYLDGLYKISGSENIRKSALRYMIYWKMLKNDNSAVIGLCKEALTLMTGEDKKWVLIDLALTHSHNKQKSEAKNILLDLRKNYHISSDLDTLITTDIRESYVPDADLQIQPDKQALPEEQVVTTPSEYSFIQNYPNPFNPTTVVKYQLPFSGHVTLKVFDILGREVVTLADGMKDAGYYSATFDGSRFSSGIYFVRMTALPQDGFVPLIKTMKMLMMK